MQGSLPAGWLAFTGRELNPLDRDEGFQITSSSLPGLFLAQRPFTYNIQAASNSSQAARANGYPRRTAAIMRGVWSQFQTIK